MRSNGLHRQSTELGVICVFSTRPSVKLSFGKNNFREPVEACLILN